MKMFRKRSGQRQNNRKLCALNELPYGVRALVRDFTGNQELRSRLCSLGLTPGTEVEVCQDFPGQCRLRVRGGSLSLDGDAAGCVLCEACVNKG